MVGIIFMIFGILSVCTGLYIFKYKKFNLAYILFYSRSIEKYPERKLVKNKTEVAQFIGKLYIILGISTLFTGLIFWTFSISEIYAIAVLLIISVYIFYNYFYINRIIKK